MPTNLVDSHTPFEADYDTLKRPTMVDTDADNG